MRCAYEFAWVELLDNSICIRLDPRLRDGLATDENYNSPLSLLMHGIDHLVHKLSLCSHETEITEVDMFTCCGVRAGCPEVGLVERPGANLYDHGDTKVVRGGVI